MGEKKTKLEDFRKYYFVPNFLLYWAKTYSQNNNGSADTPDDIIPTDFDATQSCTSVDIIQTSTRLRVVHQLILYRLRHGSELILYRLRHGSELIHEQI